MCTQKLGGAFALKSTEDSVLEMRTFFNERGLKVDAHGPKDLYKNVKELLCYVAAIAPNLPEKETELVLNAVFNISVDFEPATTDLFVQELCKILTGEAFKGKGWHSQAGVAVRILSNVFHMYTDRPKLQVLTMKTLLEIAGRSGITRCTDTSLEAFERYAQEWALTVEQKRDLLRVLHHALLADQRADAAAEIMTALLGTYTDVDADKAQDDARDCVRTAIVDPKSFSVDHLLRLSAVQGLKRTDPKIHQLLSVFASGTLVDYLKFVQLNPGFVKERLRVDETVLEKKIKMLTLISLAEKSRVLQLPQLAKDLQIGDQERLEEFLIDAIRIKAVNGKINEQKNEFVVTTFQHRSFDRPQWEQLQKRLGTLLKSMKKANENMESLLEGCYSTFNVQEDDSSDN